MINPIHVAHDGEEALHYLSGEDGYHDRTKFPLPGIVILDLKLPKVDGFQLLAWIRARSQFNHIPVIVLTSQGNDPNARRASECGADGFLMKGIDTEGLIALLKNAILAWALVPARDVTFDSA